MNDKISTFDKILSASIHLFYQNTYSNTTLQDISTASDSAMGSIYHAFPNGKSDIISEIAKRYFEEYRAGLNKILGTDIIDTDLEKIMVID